MKVAGKVSAVHKWIDSHVRTSALIRFVCACGLYAATFVKFEQVRARLDAVMPDGNAWFFSHNRFGYLVTFARLAVGLIILLAVGAIASGGRYQRAVARLRRDALAWWTDVCAACRRSFAPSEWQYTAALGLMLIIAAGVRWAFLFQPIIYDEAWTYMNFAAWPLDYALAWYQFPNNHVFHTFWVHVSVDLFGDEPWALRLPALTAGLALVPAAYVVLRRLYGCAPAVIAVALLAISVPNVRFSTCARGYTLLELAFVLCLGLGHYAITQRNSFAGILGVLVAAVGFYTVPLMVLPFSAVVLWLAGLSLQGASRRTTFSNLRGIAFCTTLTLAVTAMLYLPVFMESGVKAVAGNRFVAPLSWGVFWGALPRVVPDLWELCNEGLPTPVRLVLLAGFVAGVASSWRLGAGLVVSAFTCSLGLMIVQRVLPENRMWIWVLPVYSSVAAAGIWRLMQPFLRTTALRAVLPGVFGVVFCLVISLRLLSQNPERRLWGAEPGTFVDAAEIAGLIKAKFGEQLPIVVGHPECVPLAYHFRKRDLPIKYFRSYAEDIGGLLDREDAQRILVVVGPTSTLEGTLADTGIGADEFDTVTPVKRYPSGCVYMLSRADDER